MSILPPLLHHHHHRHRVISIRLIVGQEEISRRLVLKLLGTIDTLRMEEEEEEGEELVVNSEDQLLQHLRLLNPPFP